MYQEAFLQNFERYCEEQILPKVSDYEQQQGMDRQLVRELGQLGFLAPNLPKEYGGIALPAPEYGEFIRTCGATYNSLRELITVHAALVGESIVRWGVDHQKQRYLSDLASGETLAAFALSEPEVGSDANAVQTTYAVKSDGFELNGVKKWISFAGIADLFLVFARNAENDAEVSAFLVDRNTEGIHVDPIKNMMASRASHLGIITFSAVKLGKQSVLGRLGSGFNCIANTALDHGRHCVAWGSVGVAQAALQQMVNYSRRRKQFGQKICQLEPVQRLISDSVIEYQAAWAMCKAVAEKRQNKHLDATVETSMAKVFCARVATTVSEHAVQVFGAKGISEDYAVSRLFKEAKSLEVIEGTAQVLQNMVALHALHTFYDKNWKEA